MHVSCGLIILNEKNEVLLCEVTGGKGRHDIPKGLKEEGESALATALRECKEETGFDLQNQRIEDLGEHTYLAGKRLHLFKVKINSDFINLSEFKCSSFFDLTNKDGTVKKLPEVLNAKWIPTKNVQGLISKNLFNVLLPFLN